MQVRQEMITLQLLLTISLPPDIALNGITLKSWHLAKQIIIVR